MAGNDGLEQTGYVRWVHLIVAIHLNHDIAAGGKGRLVASDHGTPDALVFFMENNLEPGITALLTEILAGMLRAGVVHSKDTGNQGGDMADNIDDVVNDTVARYDYGNAY